MKKTVILIFTLILMLIFTGCFGNETEWNLENVYVLAVENGYTGTYEDFINEFQGVDGDDGIGISSVTLNETGHLIITYTNNETSDAGLVVFTPDYEKITPTISDNGNWYVGGEDTGVSATGGEYPKWYTGEGVPKNELGKNGDFYLDTKTLDIYNKTASVWICIGDIKNSDEVHNSQFVSNQAINEALLSSVSVHCYISETSEQAGSGVIYKLNKSRGDAYIITNYHVVYNEESGKVYANSDIKVFLYGLEYEQYAIPAQYIGGSQSRDIAVLKITSSEILKKSSACEVKFSNSDEVSVLDNVFAVGNAYDSGISATSGTVNVTSEWVQNENEDYLRVIRIDAAVNSGNSGGGLFNSDGELIGIVTLKVMTEGADNIAFAIPGNFIKAVVDGVLYHCDGESNTKLKVFYDGVDFGVSSVEMLYDEETGELQIKETVKISAVESGSAAYLAGIREGDIVTSVEISGAEYIHTRVYHLIEMKYSLKPGDTVIYNINRNGTASTITITIPSTDKFLEVE